MACTRPRIATVLPDRLTLRKSHGTARAIGDIWQRLGIGGDALGTNGVLRRTFIYSYLTAAATVAVVNTVNVVTLFHDRPADNPAGPIVSEGSSWLTLMLFFWVIWVAWRLVPLTARPRWLLLVHVPAAAIFALLHVGGFVLVRKAIFHLAGLHYDFGPFLPNYLYEVQKDSLGYVLFLGCFTLIEHLLRQQQLNQAPGQTLTFDIRDGARLIRVRLDEVLAVASAGNYVEFHLRDGRKLLMRSSLSALEGELNPRGFLRTHRSWLVNRSRLTALTPEGSGDYTIQVESVSVPLSRRYPDALAILRGS